MSPLVREVKEIIYSDPTPEKFRNLVDTLNLHKETLPTYLEDIEPAILAYMCNFIPYSEHEEFEHIGIYNMVIQ